MPYTRAMQPRHYSHRPTLLLRCVAPASVVVLCLLVSCGNDADPGTLFRPVPRGDLPAGGKTYGGTLLDVDRDGWLDLLISVHGNEAQIHFNRPGLQFPREMLPQPLPALADQHGAAACDYDHDGDWDAVVSQGAEHGFGMGTNQLWQQIAPRRFQDLSPGQLALQDHVGRGRGAVWADFDRDRRPELLLLNYASPVRLVARDSNDNWQDVTDRLPVPAAVVPWSPDRPPPTAKVRRRSTAVHAAVADDLNGDGLTDLLVLGRAGQCALWINNGGGRFWDGTVRSGLKPTLYPEPAKFAAAGDLDGDGDLDLVILHRRNPKMEVRRAPLEVWLNEVTDRSSRFIPAAGPMPPGTHDPVAAMLADLDNDGHLDLYVVHTADPAAPAAPNRLYRGDGTGGFSDATADWGGAGPVGGNPDSVWPVDLDRDGDLDLVTFNGEHNDLNQVGGVLVYENRSDDNRGLTVELAGADQPPHGLGARLELTVGNDVQTRIVASVANPINSAILPSHFGTGTAPGPYHLTIRWPDGQVQQLDLDRSGLAYRVVAGRDRAEVLPARRKP